MGQLSRPVDGVGYRQTKQNFSASRVIGSGVAGTTYYNTTGKPFFITVSAVASSGSERLTLTNGGVDTTGGQVMNLASQICFVSGLILPGEGYSVRSASASTFSDVQWNETR